MSTETDIQVLVAEHNEEEERQAARRKAIFELVRSLGGYHQVRFSTGDVWSGSLLAHPDQNVINSELAKHVHLITSWQ